MSGALGLLADPSGPGSRGLMGLRCSANSKLVGNAVQALLHVRAMWRLPIAVPHQPGLGIHAGNPWTGSIEPFLAVKNAAR